jgi:hypothetical protein
MINYENVGLIHSPHSLFSAFALVSRDKISTYVFFGLRWLKEKLIHLSTRLKMQFWRLASENKALFYVSMLLK